MDDYEIPQGNRHDRARLGDELAFVGAIYYVLGRNMPLAAQSVRAVVGGNRPVMLYLCQADISEHTGRKICGHRDRPIPIIYYLVVATDEGRADHLSIGAGNDNGPTATGKIWLCGCRCFGSIDVRDYVAAFLHLLHGCGGGGGQF
ncbi:MAG: hypothetical protein IPJ55_00010 [Chloracidobacterium sp.]|nr:hypothetical protein [Chloracidobacterium sp.]